MMRHTVLATALIFSVLSYREATAQDLWYVPYGAGYGFGYGYTLDLGSGVVQNYGVNFGSSQAFNPGSAFGINDFAPYRSYDIGQSKGRYSVPVQFGDVASQTTSQNLTKQQDGASFHAKEKFHAKKKVGLPVLHAKPEPLKMRVTGHLGQGQQKTHAAD